MLLGYVTTRFFNLPSWITPALCFNNTTSLPLLLVQSLDATGILTKLLISDSDTSSAAVQRAKSYFLVCAIVGNCLTFALGPKLLDGEHAPDPKERGGGSDEAEGANGGAEGSEDVEQQNGDASHHDNQEDADEQTSLLPDPIVRRGRQAGHKAYQGGKKFWDKLPPWAQSFLDFMYAFVNAPLIGAVIGGVIGLTPPLHRWFFNEQQEGGFFKAWLTSSIQNIGDLFAALQVVVVGVKLSTSMRAMKKGEDSGSVPWIPLVFILAVRFLVWPV